MSDTGSTATTEAFPTRSVIYVILAAAAAFAVVLSGYAALPVQHAERVYADFRTSLLSDRIVGDHPDVVIVSVGRNVTPTRTTFERNEIDRGQIARLVELIDEASPRAIGFDVPLTGPSADPSRDQALTRALREAKARVVLGIRADRADMGPERRAWYDRFLTATGRAKGHISTLREGERVVRFDGIAQSMSATPDSFATLMARALRPDIPRYTGPIAWLQRVDDTGVFSRILNIGGQQPFRVLYADDLLDGTRTFPARQLASRLVIVTSALGELEGRVTTPLTAWTGDTLAPIQVQAQAIAQLIDGRIASDIEPRTSRLLLFAVACIAGFVGWFRSRGWNIGAILGSLILLFLLDCAFFAWFNVSLPMVEGIAAWILGEIVGRHSRRVLQWEESHGQPWPLPEPAPPVSAPPLPQPRANGNGVKPPPPPPPAPRTGPTSA